ncbi:MAG TPA: D-alanyl-D-alanine carboxypeptidase/D-alanyl-D-alanine-endopeptidase [Pyrinomonadaceae bacterium]|nr:D-alanyl-D-alanine carboxypeptidase/D-alanyl-D-alanine-endopeptidase [Pyrinomonadaceae bacterium]
MIFRRTAFLLIALLLVAPSSRLTIAQESQRPRTTSTVTASGVPVEISSAQTLTELRTRIEQIVRQPALEAGFFAVKIVSLDTGAVIFEQDSRKLVRPASNMKIYTVATAFDRLTPEYRFITSVYAKEKLDDEGKVKGDLIIYGRGDPSIAARFNDGDYFKGINVLADRIVAAGVKRIKGDLVGDESHFDGDSFGSGWTWQDLQWSYGAPVSALTVNDNAIDLTVRPGSKAGAPVSITSGPPATSFMTIVNRATTSAKGTRSDLRIHRGVGANVLEISGTLPVGDDGYTGGVAIPDPALAFVAMLRDALIKRGVKIDGRLRTVNARSGGSMVPQTTSATTPALPAPVEIASLPSAPFNDIAAHTLKPSQNLYTELILRTLGKMRKSAPPADETRRAGQTDEDAGLAAVRDFLKQAGVNESQLNLDDGSGLSRSDLIMADATVQLLTFMTKHRYFAQFRDALPIAGVDGTLRNRMKGTPAEKNVRAKTGTLSSVASLGGYVTTAAGERLVFSMMLNNYADASALRRDSIDAIAVLLASFDGKTQ